MTLLKYLLIGLVNSIVGYALIVVFMLRGYAPEVSNLSGYILGFLISYILNKQFNFRSKNRHAVDFPRFIASMVVAYLLNLLTLGVLFRLMGVNPYISQLAAGAVYLLVGYGLSRAWVFRTKPQLPTLEKGDGKR